ncbi:MAG: ATP-binding protein [Coriobacteriales bacterium]|jgi:predicted AAA+ superfamily ATPase|nr:ATP-binding protein [Coriobacteriales bacterium]
MYLQRLLQEPVRQSLAGFPVTAIIGPRQAGKSTLAKHILKSVPNGVYLDLERPSDLARLENAELYLTSQRGKLVCIDEIQRMPQLFGLLRSLTDEWGTNGSFLILGSASRDLLKQSSESLAGRIAYQRLSPFSWQELAGKTELATYLARGGFPPSLLASDDGLSLLWRENFITTFLERDLREYSGASPQSIRRLWTMLAHVNGETANYSRLGSAMGQSDATVRSYIDLLASTFMVEVVPPYHSNLGKRLVKAPKVYIADSGITAALLGLKSYEEILAHPGYGALWEQAVLATVRAAAPEAEVFYYRTGGGAEIDFVVATRGAILAVECKGSLNPRPTKGTHHAIADIRPDQTLIVAPVEEGWPVAEGISVVSLAALAVLLRTL